MIAVTGGFLFITGALAGCGSLGIGDVDPVVTGSLKAQPASLPASAAMIPAGPVPDGITSSDWALARSALDEALASQDSGVSIPWANALTGARGTATPLGEVRDGNCRDFRIGIVDQTGEHWVQGAACRDVKGVVSLSQVRVLGRA